MEYLKEVDVAILHLGSYTKDNRYGAGDRHLYKTGLINILNCLTCARGEIKPQGENIIIEKDNKSITIAKEEKISKCLEEGFLESCPFREIKNGYFKNLKCVIVSELGFEMASLKEMAKAFSGFSWDNNLFPLLFYLKFLDHNDSYIKALDPDVESSFQKIRLLRRILADKSIEALGKFLMKSDDIYFINLYHFSVVFIYFIFYSDLIAISDCNKRHREIRKKIDTVLRHFEEDNSEEFSEVTKGMENYIYYYFSNLITDYNIAENAGNNKSAKKIIKNLTNFSNEIKKCLTKYKKLSESGDYEGLIHYNYKNFIRFVHSLGLSDEKCPLSGYLEAIKYQLEFYPLVSLLSELMKKTIYKIKEENIEPSRTDDDFEDELVMNRLIDILSIYSTDKFKVFVSDLGMEIGLSDDLEIKDSHGDWIKIDCATQEIDDDRLILRKKS